MTQDPLIIHHAGCSDGICGALVLWLGLGRRGELMAAQYGDEPPLDRWVKDRDVWIVDFSYPREALEHLHSLAAALHVLDHHRTAEENCVGLDFCTFDMERSGAKLAFDHMFEAGRLQLEPSALVDVLAILVQYVQDRDLWRWELDHSRELAAWFESFPRDLASWLQLLARLAELGPTRMVVEGQAVLRSNSRLVDSMARQSEEAQYHPPSGAPLSVRLCNAPVLHSEVAEQLLATHPCDFACSWRRISGGHVYNLRSTSVDVSEIAKSLGGGGHARAAGFASVHPPSGFFPVAPKEGD